MVSIAQIQWINMNLGITEYLNELGIDVPRNGKCFCPFHHNVNTPAAKVHESRDGGGGKLYCHSERRMYSTYDVIKALGYTEEQIKRLVPREHWYTLEEEAKQKPLHIPKVDSSIKVLSSSVFEYLDRLETIWEEQVKE